MKPGAGILITGTTPRKQLLQFDRNFKDGMNRALGKSARQTALLVKELAIENAPKSSGRLKDNIRMKRSSTGNYIVYVKKIPAQHKYTRHSKSDATTSSHLYPLAQERGFKPHWIHTSMIAPDVRSKFEPDGEERFVHIKHSTPYALPAYLSVIKPNKRSTRTARGLFNKQVRDEMKKLTKRMIRKGAYINKVNFT